MFTSQHRGVRPGTHPRPDAGRRAARTRRRCTASPRRPASCSAPTTTRATGSTSAACASPASSARRCRAAAPATTRSSCTSTAVRIGAYEAFCRADTRIPLMYMPDGVARAGRALRCAGATGSRAAVYNIAAFSPRADEIADVRGEARAPTPSSPSGPIRAARRSSTRGRAPSTTPTRAATGAGSHEFDLEQMTDDLVPQDPRAARRGQVAAPTEEAHVRASQSPLRRHPRRDPRERPLEGGARHRVAAGAPTSRSAAREVVNFCANNYLGLSSHPEVIAAARASLDERGYGLSSVRFICGTQDRHKELEAAISPVPRHRGHDPLHVVLRRQRRPVRDPARRARTRSSPTRSTTRRSSTASGCARPSATATSTTTSTSSRRT